VGKKRRRAPGEGSVSQRADTGKWRAAIVIGYDTQGNPRRIRKDFTTRKEADAWLTEQRAALGKGELTTSTITVTALAEQWLKSHERAGRRENTLSSYRTMLGQWVLPHLGTIKIADLKPIHIANWLETIQAQTVYTVKPHDTMVGIARGARTTQQRLRESNPNASDPLVPGTPLTIPGATRYLAHKAHAYLSMILNRGVELELVPRNVAHKARAPKPPKPRLSRLSSDEVRAVLQWTREQQHPIHAYLHLVFVTAMRKEELLGLRWADIDLKQRLITINQTVTFVGGRAIFGPAKTDEGHRTIYLDEQTVRLLERQQEHVRALEANVSKRKGGSGGWKDHNLVFPSVLGTPLSDKTLRLWWLNVIAATGVNRVRLYDTRSTWGSEAARRRMSPKTIAKRMGHKDERFTFARYVRPNEDEMRQAAVPLDEMYGTDLKLVEPDPVMDDPPTNPKKDESSA
jgi:integrase